MNRSDHFFRSSIFVILLMFTFQPLAAQKKKKKLSRQEKKQLKFEQAREAISDTTYSFRADKVDLPHKLNTWSGSIVHIIKDRIEILEIQWPDRGSRSSEMYTASGTISNYFVIDEPGTNSVSIRFTAETQDKRLYFTITHALNESNMVITDRPGYALTNYTGTIRPRDR